MERGNFLFEELTLINIFYLCYLIKLLIYFLPLAFRFQCQVIDPDDNMCIPPEKIIHLKGSALFI